jgi:hypothetical protein
MFKFIKNLFTSTTTAKDVEKEVNPNSQQETVIENKTQNTVNEVIVNSNQEAKEIQGSTIEKINPTFLSVEELKSMVKLIHQDKPKNYVLFKHGSYFDLNEKSAVELTTRAKVLIEQYKKEGMGKTPTETYMLPLKAGGVIYVANMVGFYTYTTKEEFQRSGFQKVEAFCRHKRDLDAQNPEIIEICII